MNKDQLIDLIKERTNQLWEENDQLVGKSDMESLFKKYDIGGQLTAYRDILTMILNSSIKVRCTKCQKLYDKNHPEYDYIVRYGFCIGCEQVETDRQYDNQKVAEMGDSAEDFIR